MCNRLRAASALPGMGRAVDENFRKRSAILARYEWKGRPALKVPKRPGPIDKGIIQKV